MTSLPHGAMNVEFWRDENKLNVFRTTRCQRLAVEGKCQWGSKCQFSHCLDWPRRQPKKYRYSPELCPSIGQAEQCVKGVNCPFAHSMEEVLFHPELFKTILCAEQGRARRNKDVGKPNRCHRYYCPFAHGKKELRESSYEPEQLDAFYRALEKFPSDDCCGFCAPRVSAAASGGGAVEPPLPEIMPLPAEAGLLNHTAGPLLLGGVTQSAAFRMSRLFAPGLSDELAMMAACAAPKFYDFKIKDTPYVNPHFNNPQAIPTSWVSEAKPIMKQMEMEPAYIRIVDGIASVESKKADEEVRIFNML
jgi:hypothetical protein